MSQGCKYTGVLQKVNPDPEDTRIIRVSLLRCLSGYTATLLA